MAAPQVQVYQPSTHTVAEFAALFPGTLGTSGLGLHDAEVPGNGATTTWYADLASALAANPAALRGRGVIINSMGSYLFAYPDSGFGVGGLASFDGEPETVSELVRAGYVWVDACSLPISGRWIYDTIPLTSQWDFAPITPDLWSDGSGAVDLLTLMGFSSGQLQAQPAAGTPQPWAPGGTGLVVTRGVSSQIGSAFPYPSAFTVNTSPATGWPSNVVLPGVGSMPALASAPMGSGTSGGYAQYAITLFGVRYGTGMYVYANQDNGVGVTAADCASFIVSALASQAVLNPGPWQSASSPGAPAGSGGGWTRDVWIGLGVLAAGIVLIGGVDFLGHYVLARAGAGQTVVEVQR